MTGIGPWLAVAGVGALHGLNPATGWGLVAWGVRAGERARTWQALAPIALGHASSVALVAALTALGMAAGRGLLPWLAGGGAVFAAAVHVSVRGCGRVHAAAAPTGLALWSLAAGTLHGAGMMLVPALVPLCMSASPGREITASGSMALALAAVAVHLASMLCVTAALGTLAGRSWGAWRRRAGRTASRP
ncbi:MAG: hypothetical protein JF586_21130 [Burkholderiales bacterium]|nr:hypothetical protein [Burkholderiales bacterium]